jgi:hypothetical protein
MANRWVWQRQEFRKITPEGWQDRRALSDAGIYPYSHLLALAHLSFLHIEKRNAIPESDSVIIYWIIECEELRALFSEVRLVNAGKGASDDCEAVKEAWFLYSMVWCTLM